LGRQTRRPADPGLVAHLPIGPRPQRPQGHPHHAPHHLALVVPRCRRQVGGGAKGELDVLRGAVRPQVREEGYGVRQHKARHRRRPQVPEGDAVLQHLPRLTRSRGAKGRPLGHVPHPLLQPHLPRGHRGGVRQATGLHHPRVVGVAEGPTQEGDVQAPVGLPGGHQDPNLQAAGLQAPVRLPGPGGVHGKGEGKPLEALPGVVKVPVAVHVPAHLVGEPGGVGQAQGVAPQGPGLEEVGVAYGPGRARLPGGVRVKPALPHHAKVPHHHARKRRGRAQVHRGPAGVWRSGLRPGSYLVSRGPVVPARGRAGRVGEGHAPEAIGDVKPVEAQAVRGGRPAVGAVRGRHHHPGHPPLRAVLPGVVGVAAPLPVVQEDPPLQAEAVEEAEVLLGHIGAGDGHAPASQSGVDEEPARGRRGGGVGGVGVVVQDQGVGAGGYIGEGVGPAPRVLPSLPPPPRCPAPASRTPWPRPTSPPRSSSRWAPGRGRPGRKRENRCCFCPRW